MWMFFICIEIFRTMNFTCLQLSRSSFEETCCIIDEVFSFSSTIVVISLVFLLSPRELCNFRLLSKSLRW